MSQVSVGAPWLLDQMRVWLGDGISMPFSFTCSNSGVVFCARLKMHKNAARLSGVTFAKMMHSSFSVEAALFFTNNTTSNPATMDSSLQKPNAHQSEHQSQHKKLQSPQTKHVSHSQSAKPTSGKWLPHEARLRKAWRVIGTTVVNCISKAEKAADPSLVNSHVRESKKRELDESIVFFLRTRREFHRLLSHAEAKLQGKAEEMESLETYVRTQPRVGTRKRKREWNISA